MVDPDKIKQLVEMMSEHDLSEISLRDGEEEVLLKRRCDKEENVACMPAMMPHMPPMAFAQPQMHMPQAPAPAADAASSDAGANAAEDSDLIAIKSPMVGTFYTAPNPESPPYVTEGSTVTPGTVVCILEAMKVFNEIKAETSGTIAKVLVKNEAAVEFGQTLFLVKPS